MCSEKAPAVEWPVVLLEGHDVLLCVDDADLQQALEPWMAHDDTFEFYDARGRRLCPFVALQVVGVMLCPDDIGSHSEHLTKVLKHYLDATGARADRPAELRKFIAGLEQPRGR